MTATSTRHHGLDRLTSAAQAHCASRLLERYSLTKYVEACALYDRHSRLLMEGQGTQLYEAPDGSRAMRLYDRGQVYYPVLKRTRRGDEEIITTYLSESMAQHNLKRKAPWLRGK